MGSKQEEEDDGWRLRNSELRLDSVNWLYKHQQATANCSFGVSILKLCPHFSGARIPETHIKCNRFITILNPRLPSSERCYLFWVIHSNRRGGALVSCNFWNSAHHGLQACGFRTPLHGSIYLIPFLILSSEFEVSQLYWCCYCWSGCVLNCFMIWFDLHFPGPPSKANSEKKNSCPLLTR